MLRQRGYERAVAEELASNIVVNQALRLAHASLAQSLPFTGGMSQTVEHLLALQKLHFQTKPLLVAEEARIRALRKKVPLLILTQFDRLIVRGKKAVAIARQGVCSECHLRISSGSRSSLAYASEIHTCEHCGRYLYLPEDEPLGFADPRPLIKPAGKSEAPAAQKKKAMGIA